MAGPGAQSRSRLVKILKLKCFRVGPGRAAWAKTRLIDRLEVPSAPQRERDDEIEAALDDAFGLGDEESADENDDAFDKLELEEEPASFRFG